MQSSWSQCLLRRICCSKLRCESVLLFSEWGTTLLNLSNIRDRRLGKQECHPHKKCHTSQGCPHLQWEKHFPVWASQRVAASDTACPSKDVLKRFGTFQSRQGKSASGIRYACRRERRRQRLGRGVNLVRPTSPNNDHDPVLHLQGQCSRHQWRTTATKRGGQHRQHHVRRQQGNKETRRGHFSAE